MKSNMISWKDSIGCRCEFIYDDIQGYIDIISYNNNTKLTIMYNGELFDISYCKLKNCALAKVLGKRTAEFRLKIGETLKDDKRNITIIDTKNVIKHKNKYSYNTKYYQYKCNQCGDEDWVCEYNLLKSYVCRVCSGYKIVQGVNDIPTTAPWMVEYFQGGYDEAKLYTKSSDKKIIPICPDCGRSYGKAIKISSICTNESIGCVCSDGISYPNKVAFFLLEYGLNLKYGEDFEREVQFEYFGKKKVDFVLIKKHLIIEVDGNYGNHNDSRDYFRDFLNFKYGGFRTIRINLTGVGDTKNNNIIKNEFITKMDKYFNMQNIDWTKKELFTTELKDIQIVNDKLEEIHSTIKNLNL